MSWASNLAASVQDWVPIIQIAGVGMGLSNGALAAANSDGRIRFCTFHPALFVSETSALWRALLTEMPSSLSERADPLGGSQELGALSFSLLDADNYLTGLLRTERGPLTSLTVAVTSSTTAWTVGTTTGISQYDAIWIGDEAVRVASVDSGTTLTVVRGYLGTTARSHDAGDRVFQSTPILESREVTYSLIPQSATSWSDAREIGTFVIDGISWNASTNIWTFSARSQLRYLGRVVPYRPQAMTIGLQPVLDARGNRIGDGDWVLNYGAGSQGAQANTDLREWTGTEADNDHLFYVQVEDEVISLAAASSYVNAGLRPLRRSVTGGPEVTIEPGAVARRVFVARAGVGADAGSFRFSPGPTPATSRSSGTWTRTAHWIDLLLILMLSSHDEDDGLELTNYLGSGTDFARSNFASLPTGYGLGMPAAEVDFDAFFALKQRTINYTLPNFTFGAKVEPFGRLIEREFLKPMGAFLSVSSGEARIVLPRMPLASSSTISLGSADLLSRMVGGGLHEPRLSLQRRAASTSQVVYELGPTAEAFPVDHGQYRDTFGGRGAFGDTGDPVRIPVPGADPAQPGIWQERAIARLFRAHRPQFVVKGDFAPANAYGWAVGDLASLTLDALPNMRDATRGWSEFQLQLLERSVEVDGAAGRTAAGVYLAVQAQAYGPEARAGRICPTAYVSSSAGNVATCTANRYTEADAADGLPTTDVGAFSVGDICRIVDASGVINVAAGTAEVVTVTEGSNTIEFDSDFNGELGVGAIIVYAGSADSVAAQLNGYAYWADRTNQTIGATTRAPWPYGEG